LIALTSSACHASATARTTPTTGKAISMTANAATAKPMTRARDVSLEEISEMMVTA
jgi:hypothetical protein